MGLTNILKPNYDDNYNQHFPVKLSTIYMYPGPLSNMQLY